MSNIQQYCILTTVRRCATHLIYIHAANLMEVLSGGGSYQYHWTGGKTQTRRRKSLVISGHTEMGFQVFDCGILESQIWQQPIYVIQPSQ